MKLKTTLLSSTLVALVVADSAALAQTELTEIVVTAQRRAQSVQDVPIAITAIDGDTLSQLGIEQPVDLARITPGLSTANATSGGTPIFAVRGIGLDDFNPNNNSGVATYVDDVGISSPALLGGQLFDIDRVEVLKGPQGTLYGRNATGGAVNIYSRQPTDTAEGYFNVDYGRWNTVEVNSALSGPLGDTLSGRIAGTYRKASDGYQTDIDTGREYGKPNRLALRTLLEYQPTDTFTAVLNIHASRDRSIAASPQAEGNEALLGPDSIGLVDTGTDDPAAVRVGVLRPRRDDNGVGGVLNLTYKFEDATLTSITGYDRYTYRSVDNFDGMPGPTFDFFQNDRIRQFYQEVRLASREGLFDGLVDWLVGGSYSHDTIHGRDASDQSASFIGAWLSPPDFVTPGMSIAQADYNQTRDSFGVFANTETHFTERLSLALGLRYSRDRIDFDGISTEEGSVDGGVAFQGQGSVVDSLDEVHNVSKVSYRGSLNYQIGDALFYATVSNAYKSGAYYASPALDQAAWGYVKPETITAYEVGGKSRLFDGTLLLNASAFEYDYEDRQSQLLYVSPASGLPVASLGTIPKSRVRGFEVEAILRPVAGLDLSGSVSRLSTRIRETATDVRGAPLYANVPVGSELAQAPDWSYALRSRYGYDVSATWRGSLQLDYNWSGQQAAALADPNAVYGPQKNLGARLEFAQIGSGLSIALWGRNLTDERRSTYSFTSFYGGRVVYRQEPLSYGVQLGYSF